MRTPRSFWLAAPAVLLWLSCGTSDPCGDQAGACLTIEAQGAVGSLDALHIDLRGAVRYGFTSSIPDGPKPLPVLAGVLLPLQAQGQVTVSGYGLLSGATVAIGATTAMVAPDARVMVALPLAAAAGATCSDQVMDGSETDVDCGGGTCGPCADGLGCAVDDDCTSRRCQGKTCGAVVPAITEIQPRLGPTTGGVPVTISGSGFTTGLQVSFAGAPAQVTQVSGQQITAVLPQQLGTLGKVEVSVVNPDGQKASTAQLFGYYYGAIGFKSATYGSAARSFAFGDFNKDGKPDLASVNPTLSTMSIFHGTGDGAFAIRFSNGTGTSPFEVVAADFNKDKLVDLAVSSTNTGSVNIFLGRTDGSFLLNTTLTVLSANSLLAEDFTGDGNPDVLVGNSASGSYMLFPGNGTGGFGVPTTITLPGSSVAMVAGDFNGDGRVDFAAGMNTTSQVSVVLNSATGLNKISSYNVFSSVFALTAADTNGNGRLDLLAGHRTTVFSVLGGVDTGTFMNFITYPATNGEGIAAGDVNGDGVLDVVVGSGSLNVLPGKPGGGFQAPIALATAGAIVKIIAADLNGDGKMDFATASLNNGVTVYLNSSQ